MAHMIQLDKIFIKIMDRAFRKKRKEDSIRRLVTIKELISHKSKIFKKLKTVSKSTRMDQY